MPGLSRAIGVGLAWCAIACGAPRPPRVEAPSAPPVETVETVETESLPTRSCRFETENEVRVEEWDERGRWVRTEVTSEQGRRERRTRYEEDGAVEVHVPASGERTRMLRFELGRGTVVERVRDQNDHARWFLRQRVWLDDEGRVTRVLTNGDPPSVTRCVRAEDGRLAAIFERTGEDDLVRWISYDADGRLAQIEERAEGSVYVTTIRYEGDRATVDEGAEGEPAERVTTTSAGCTDELLGGCAPSFRIGLPEAEPAEPDLTDEQQVREAYARATGEILEDDVVRARDVIAGVVLLVEPSGALRGAFVAGEYLREEELPARALGLLGYARADESRRAELARRWLERVRPSAHEVMTEAPAGWPPARGTVRAPTFGPGANGARVVVLWERRREGYLRWEHTIDPSGVIRSRLLEQYDGLR